MKGLYRESFFKINIKEIIVILCFSGTVQHVWSLEQISYKAAKTDCWMSYCKPLCYMVDCCVYIMKSLGIINDY